jgi:hypothetical protein
VLCSLIEVDRYFRGAYCLHHQGDEQPSAKSNWIKVRTEEATEPMGDLEDQSLASMGAEMETWKSFPPTSSTGPAKFQPGPACSYFSTHFLHAAYSLP